MEQGSSDVYINDRGAVRFGDRTTAHLVPSRRCFVHVASVNQGSRSVFINGKRAARVGDSIAGCTSIAQGSRNVFIGD